MNAARAGSGCHKMEYWVPRPLGESWAGVGQRHSGCPPVLPVCRVPGKDRAICRETGTCPCRLRSQSSTACADTALRMRRTGIFPFQQELGEIVKEEGLLQLVAAWGFHTAVPCTCYPFARMWWCWNINRGELIKGKGQQV